MKKNLITGLLVALFSLSPAQAASETTVTPLTTGYWTGWVLVDSGTSNGTYITCHWAYYKNTYMQLNPATGEYVARQVETKTTENCV